MAAPHGHGKKLNSAANARLKQDYIRIKKDPIPYIVAEPVHSNILQWLANTTEI